MTDLSRKPFARDFRLFGGFEGAGRLNYWLDVDAWELEDAVALTLGKNPLDLSEVIIREKCPEEIANRKLARTQPEAVQPLAQLYMERYERLKRAAIAESLPSVERGGKIWFKPHDFLTWYDTKSGWKDGFLPVATEAMLKEWRANARTASNADTQREKPRADSDSDSDANADAEKGKAPASSLGVSKAAKVEGGFSSLGELKDKKGVRETWALMCSELRKPLDKRQFGTMRKLREHCEDTFDIGFHDCVKVSTKASQEPGSIRYKPGKLSKRKAS